MSAHVQVSKGSLLLKELGLTPITALQVVLEFRADTTLGYPKGDYGDTVFVRATALSMTPRGLLFSFPQITPAPTLDIASGSHHEDKLWHDDELIIMGLEYQGDGNWFLIGDFSSEDPHLLEEYYNSRAGNLIVLVLK